MTAPASAPSPRHPTVALIVAVGRNGVIGQEGGMPWRLSSDLRRFRQLTMGKPVVMGRRTFESIGKPLIGRENLLVTRDPAFAPAGVRVFADLTAALDKARRIAVETGVEEVMIAGGGTVYEACMPLADRLYVTHVDAAPEGDTRFPAIDPADWVPVSAEDIPRGDRDSADMRFVIYERRRP